MYSPLIRTIPNLDRFNNTTFTRICAKAEEELKATRKHVRFKDPVTPKKQISPQYSLGFIGFGRPITFVDGTVKIWHDYRALPFEDSHFKFWFDLVLSK